MKAVHQQLLVLLITIFVVKKDPSQTENNPAFLVVISALSGQDRRFFLLLVGGKLSTRFQRPIDYDFDHVFIADQKFVVGADFIDETRSTHSFPDMGDHIRHVLHEDLFGLHIVEAKDGQILIDREESPSMDLRRNLLPDVLDISY